MKYLVVGAAGYVGSVLVRKLLKEGHYVRAMDNGYVGSVANLIELTTDPNFEFVWGDVSNIKEVQKNIKGMDGIFNLAALVGAPVCADNQALSYSTTVTGTSNLIKVKEDRRLVFCSTESVYGKQSSEYEEGLTPNPSSEYAQHKLEAETLVSSSPDGVSFRFAAGMGLGIVPRTNVLVNTLVYEALTNKCLIIYQADVVRNFISVYDMVDCLIFGMENKLKEKVYNAGGVSCTKRDIAGKLREILNVNVFNGDTHKDVDQRDGVLNCTRLSEAGFTPSRGLDETIKELVKGLPLLKRN